MTHFGHFNMLRQASEICDEVIVLVISDEAAAKRKGPTLMDEKCRTKLIQGCKWVDEVYLTDHYDPVYSDLEKFNADFLIHGDDVVVDENGVSIY